MLPNNFHFAAPFWLWALIALPVIWLFYGLFYKGHKGAYNKLKEFADPHLLPHLMSEGDEGKARKGGIYTSLLLWSLIWAGAILAMAGPRWDYTQVKAFTPSRNLVMILDLSRSMDAQDIKPSRLIRARQEIEDILNLGGGLRYALVTFDATAHIITPLSDDIKTLKYILPSLTTDIVYTQGANLKSALKMAGGMLASVGGREKHILILSDGGFDDGDASILRAEKELRQQNVRVHVMAVGTKSGAPIPNGKKGLIKDNGNIVISKLDSARLKRIASDGGGLYLKASYLDNDVKRLLSYIKLSGSGGKEAQKTTRFWEEHFYIFLFPLIFFMLPWFRRGATFPLILMLLAMQPISAQAFEWKDLFLNKAQKGEQAVQEHKYNQAIENFDDPYRKGVAQYKAGDYEAAEQSFQNVDRKEIENNAIYNLANAQLMSGKVEDAIKTYEDVLKKYPDHKEAKYNLEIAKKLLEQQKKNQQDQKNDKNQKDQKQNNQKSDKNKDQDENKKGENSDKQEDKENSQKDKSDKKQSEDSSKNSEQKEDKSDMNKSSKSDGKDQKQSEEEKKQQDSKGGKQAQEQEQKQSNDNQQQKQSENSVRTQKDIDADQWLNRVESNTEDFLKNKFYIESKRAGAKEGVKSW